MKYQLPKQTCTKKNWNQSTGRCDIYEPLGAYTPIYVTFSKSTIGLKI